MAPRVDGPLGRKHVHQLVPHCKSPAGCPWVRCKTKGCGFYGTLDGTKWAYTQ